MADGREEREERENREDRVDRDLVDQWQPERDDS